MIHLKDLTDIEVEGIDHADFPDYCDARITAAMLGSRELTDEELDTLNEDTYENGVNEYILQYASEKLMDAGDYYE